MLQKQKEDCDESDDNKYFDDDFLKSPKIH